MMYLKLWDVALLACVRVLMVAPLRHGICWRLPGLVLDCSSTVCMKPDRLQLSLCACGLPIGGQLLLICCCAALRAPLVRWPSCIGTGAVATGAAVHSIGWVCTESVAALRLLLLLLLLLHGLWQRPQWWWRERTGCQAVGCCGGCPSRRLYAGRFRSQQPQQRRRTAVGVGSARQYGIGGPQPRAGAEVAAPVPQVDHPRRLLRQQHPLQDLQQHEKTHTCVDRAPLIQPSSHPAYGRELPTQGAVTWPLHMLSGQMLSHRCGSAECGLTRSTPPSKAAGLVCTAAMQSCNDIQLRCRVCRVEHTVLRVTCMHTLGSSPLVVALDNGLCMIQAVRWGLLTRSQQAYLQAMGRQ
jgi:hypothetical protein